MVERAQDLLDKALTYEPGRGVVIDCGNTATRDALRQRLFSAMSVDVRLSKTTDDPASPGWGTHRWTDVRVQKISDHKLWVGRLEEHTIGEVMTLAEALKGG